MDLKVLDAKGKQTDVVKGSDILFSKEYNEGLVHQLVTSHLANARRGTRSQKTRSDVKASNRKPYRQKGTGRARAGTVASPIWRGGGRAFPSSPKENFSKKINRKMFRAGMAAILSQLVREDRFSVIEDLDIDSPKTRLLAQKIQQFGFDSVLLITAVDENLYLSSRNLANFKVLEPKQVDPVSLIRYGNTLITKDAVQKFEEVFL